MAITNHQNLKTEESGFALVFVLVFVAMILGIVGDVVYQSQIAARTSIQTENEVQAEGAARTGVEFASLLLALHNSAANFKDLPFPLPKDLYGLLNGQPIGPQGFDDLAAISKINVASLLPKELTAALAPIQGFFVINVESESKKFNLNILQGAYSNDGKEALMRFFSTPTNTRFLEIYGYTPERLVTNLVAYIKSYGSGQIDEGQVANDYSRMGAKYGPKKGALETLDELRRIPGFNIDDIYNMYAPYFTVWPREPQTGFLNINSAPIELIASMLSRVGQEPKTATTAWMKLLKDRDAQPLQKNGIGSWFQTNLEGFSGDEVNEKIRKNIFGADDTVFKVESRGVVNGTERTLVIVFQKKDKNQYGGSSAPRQPSRQPGDQGSGSSGQGSSQSASGGSGKSQFVVIYNQWSS